MSRYPVRHFRLLEYDRAGWEFINEAIHALMRQKNELFRSFRVEQLSEIPEHRLTIAGDEVVDSAPTTVRMEFAANTGELINGNYETFFAGLDSAAEQGLASIMPRVFEQISEITDAAGQTINAAGRPLSHDLITQMLEKIDIDFDENDNPKMPTLVMHPKMAERLRALGEPSEEDTRRFNELIERKRKEFHARRRTRRLPRQP
jgi:hypothetical protein